MKLSHILLFLLGATFAGLILGLIDTSFFANAVDISPWALSLLMITKWTLVVWACTIGARSLELWNIRYKGEKNTPYPRIDYVGAGFFGIIYLIYAIFGMNPLWAILADSDLSRNIDAFWKEKI